MELLVAVTEESNLLRRLIFDVGIWPKNAKDQRQRYMI
jgi:hypothetical protein